MKQEQIKILIDTLAASDLSELEYSEDGCTLRLVKQAATNSTQSERSAGVAEAAGDLFIMPPTSTVADGHPTRQCLAPLYGVVHLQASPGDAPFVQPGQRVVAGQTLCVIEAMKVFNEVRADADATIDEVLVRSGDEVEAGQALFNLA